jgi:D-alanyl-D-alanine carboxypeptidase
MGIASSSALNDARAAARPGTAGSATGRSATGSSAASAAEAGGSVAGRSVASRSRTGGSVVDGPLAGGSRTGGSVTKGPATGGAGTGSATGKSAASGSAAGGSVPDRPGAGRSRTSSAVTSGPVTGGARTGGTRTAGSATGRSTATASETGGSVSDRPDAGRSRTSSAVTSRSVALGPVTSGAGTGGAIAAARAEAVTAGDAGLARVLHRLTSEDGVPGALAEVRDRRGDRTLTSGVANLETGAPMRGNARFRIGSMTKPYVATVVLQLVGEHRVALDAPVERYLPGLIRGAGNDGRRVTVRELLQQTSGLPDYLTYYTPQDVLADRYAHHEPADLLRIALAHRPLFAPGTRWNYSNTNYLLAGMLIEKVTGRSYGEEIQRRVLIPLGLHATSVPGDGTSIPGAHPHGYARPAPGSAPIDVTYFNPSVAAGSGDMISSASDMSRFFDALLRGRLLGPAELAAMKRTRATGDPGRRYGLGLERRRLPCGGAYWGHDGDILGFATMSGITPDGRRATVMANLDPGGSAAQDKDLRAALTTALCS